MVVLTLWLLLFLLLGPLLGLHTYSVVVLQDLPRGPITPPARAPRPTRPGEPALAPGRARGRSGWAKGNEGGALDIGYDSVRRRVPVECNSTGVARAWRRRKENGRRISSTLPSKFGPSGAVPQMAAI